MAPPSTVEPARSCQPAVAARRERRGRSRSPLPCGQRCTDAETVRARAPPTYWKASAAAEAERERRLRAVGRDRETAAGDRSSHQPACGDEAADPGGPEPEQRRGRATGSRSSRPSRSPSQDQATASQSDDRRREDLVEQFARRDRAGVGRGAGRRALPPAPLDPGVVEADRRRPSACARPASTARPRPRPGEDQQAPSTMAIACGQRCQMQSGQGARPPRYWNARAPRSRRTDPSERAERPALQRAHRRDSGRATEVAISELGSTFLQTFARAFGAKHHGAAASVKVDRRAAPSQKEPPADADPVRAEPALAAAGAVAAAGRRGRSAA